MGFFWQEYQSRLPCPPPEDLPNPGIKPKSPALQADPLLSETPGKPIHRAVKVLSPLSALHLILQKPWAAPEGFSEHIKLCLARTLPLYLECLLLHTSLQLLIILLASRGFLLQAAFPKPCSVLPRRSCLSTPSHFPSWRLQLDVNVFVFPFRLNSWGADTGSVIFISLALNTILSA